MDFTRPFRSDPLRHEGVRPVNIWGLRLFYFLMLVFVAPFAWRVLLAHRVRGIRCARSPSRCGAPILHLPCSGCATRCDGCR